MSHVASGMGRVASGVGHVASGAARVASGVGHAVAPAARLAQKALPIVEDVVEAAALSGDYSPADPFELPADDPPAYVSQAGPLIDNHDPCNACPEDLACDQCLGTGGVACQLTPPDAFTRCESSVAP